MPETDLPTRSRFVTATSWASIVLSAVLLPLAAIMNAAAFLLIDEAQLASAGVPPEMLGFIRVTSLAFLLITLFVLIASIGLLRRQNWARVAFIVMLAVGIVWSGMGIGAYFGIGPEALSPVANAGQQTVPLQIISLVLSVALIVVSVWLIKRLVAAPIRDEFR